MYSKGFSSHMMWISDQYDCHGNAYLMSFMFVTTTSMSSAYSKSLGHIHRKDDTFYMSILIIFAIMLINNEKYCPLLKRTYDFHCFFVITT